jgi:hypothetical protein
MSQASFKLKKYFEEGNQNDVSDISPSVGRKAVSSSGCLAKKK